LNQKTGKGECDGTSRNVDFVVVGTTPARAIIATRNSWTTGAAYGPHGPAQSVRQSRQAANRLWMPISLRSSRRVTMEEVRFERSCDCVSEARTMTSFLCTSISLQSIALLTTAAGTRKVSMEMVAATSVDGDTRARHLRQIHWGTMNCQRFSWDHGRPQLVMLRFLDVEVEFPQGLPFAARFEVAVKNSSQMGSSDQSKLDFKYNSGTYRSRTSSRSFIIMRKAKGSISLTWKSSSSTLRVSHIRPPRTLLR